MAASALAASIAPVAGRVTTGGVSMIPPPRPSHPAAKDASMMHAPADRRPRARSSRPPRSDSGAWCDSGSPARRRSTCGGKSRRGPSSEAIERGSRRPLPPPPPAFMPPDTLLPDGSKTDAG
jgi:hypothetical protein